jgi:hypothetical protein
MICPKCGRDMTNVVRLLGIEWREELLEPPPWENKSEATNG